MRKIFISAICLALFVLIIRINLNIDSGTEKVLTEEKACKEISGIVEKGETLFDIFKKYKLSIKNLFELKEASANIHRLKNLYPGRSYKIIVDDNNQISSFVYWIDDDYILNINLTETGFIAEKKPINYEKRVLHIGGVIKDNLISSIGEGKEKLLLALQLSDIFAWDIDFATDIRNGDTFKIVVEGLYLDGRFKKYGDILAAEFVNDGKSYFAYRFEYNGKADYYDEDGKSLRRAFLKAPLSFRRISSTFSARRFHPVLKIYRPHHGIDYAAPEGTPVSAIGDGRIIFAGRKGQYGNLVIIKHLNGYKTYYGHLARFAKGIKKGTRIEQGQIIGFVGSTGLATGPHLHYEVRVNNRPVNPDTVKPLRGDAISGDLIAEFRGFKNQMDERLASIMPTTVLAKN